MRNRILLFVFLVLGLFFSINTLAATNQNWLVSTGENQWDRGEAGKLYTVSVGEVFEVIDGEDKIISKFKDFNSNDIKMDKDGLVSSFHGSTGEYLSASTINRDIYHLPAKAKFEYKLGTLTTEFNEDGGEIFYKNKNCLGENCFGSMISGKGKINIKKDGTFFSDKDMQIFNHESGNIKLTSFGNNGIKGKLGIDGKLSHIEYGTKATFEEYGFDVSDYGEGTDIYYGAGCLEKNSYLCLDTNQFTFGRTNGKTLSVVEFKDNNIFYKNSGDNGFVQFWQADPNEAVNPNGDVEFIVKKDFVSVSGEGRIINGNHKFNTLPDGNIKVSSVEGSTNTIMPMKIYTSNKGAENDYFINVEEGGVLKAEKMGMIEKAKYLAQKTFIGDRYNTHTTKTIDAMETNEFIEEVIDNSQNVQSTSEEFSGEWPDGIKDEDVNGIAVYVPSGDPNRPKQIAILRSYMGGSTLPQADALNTCMDLDINCAVSKNTINELIRKSNSGNGMSFYATFTTGPKGSRKAYYIGDKSLAPN